MSLRQLHENERKEKKSREPQESLQIIQKQNSLIEQLRSGNQSQSEQIEKLNSENRAQSEEIAQLNSENQRLAQQLQQQNVELQNLNERIVKLSGSDKTLQDAQRMQHENENWSRQLSERETNVRGREQEAEDTISRYKDGIAKNEETRQNFDQRIAEEAARRTAEIKDHYATLEDQLKKEYEERGENKEQDLIQQYQTLLDKHTDELDRRHWDDVDKEAAEQTWHYLKRVIIIAVIVCAIFWLAAVGHAHSILTYTATAATTISLDEDDKYYDGNAWPISRGTKIRLIWVDDGTCAAYYTVPGTFGHKAVCYLSTKKLKKYFERNGE